MSKQATYNRLAPLAFFDLDGTLLPLPSLELRFDWFLWKRGLLRPGQFLRWFREAARLAPRGFSAVRLANKMHFRGVSVQEVLHTADVFAPFFPEALERLHWHAEQGHQLVILSGTLEPLAAWAAQAIAARLAVLGGPPSLRVIATRLGVSGDVWTGHVLDEPVAGPAKVRAAARLACAEGLRLGDCYAYADGLSDRWLLGAAGHPFVVNPSWRLARLARANGWPVLDWRDVKNRGGMSDAAGGRHASREQMQGAGQWPEA
jgi:HAD superfamily hydrolase (TIGR01490 family)